MTGIRVCHASTEESSMSLFNLTIERTTAQSVLLNSLQTGSRPLTDHPSCPRHFSQNTDHQRGTTSKAHSLVESQYVVKRRSPSLSSNCLLSCGSWYTTTQSRTKNSTSPSLVSTQTFDCSATHEPTNDTGDLSILSHHRCHRDISPIAWEYLQCLSGTQQVSLLWLLR